MRDRHTHPGAATRDRNGQIAVFLLMALVVLAFMVLWTVDVRRIVFLKGKSQDAGDAAALAAARWQGSTLNLIGEVNLLRSLALSGDDAAAAATEDALTNMQARLCFTGPMAAFAASQQAAKQNGIYAQPERYGESGEPLTFPAFVRTFARSIEAYDTHDIPPPYEGGWTDYAAMLHTLVDDGIATGANFLPDGADDDHILRLRAFYDAVAGPRWCWFHHNHPTLLSEYTDPSFWPPLPDPVAQVNADFFSLSLIPVPLVLDQIVRTADLEAIADDALKPEYQPAVISTQATQTVHSWYVYNPSRWNEWTIMDPDGPDAFPIVGSVLPHYDYTGADSVVSVEAAVSRMTPGLDGSSLHDTILWTAAAKPFGYLEADGEWIRPDAWSLVLPAFHDVRLIPMDAASSGSNGADDTAWVLHKYLHLPPYVATGETTPGCWYCSQLTVWERAEFRAAGVEWLGLHSDRCTIPPPSGGGGGGRGGGTRRGH